MIRRLLLAIPLILLAWPALAACNPAASTCVGVVNIRSPAYGAVGNGSHDDTAAIQSAIDYAFANNLSAVYCPAGTYKTSSTIYLDPPGNLRTNPTNPPLSQFSMAFFGDPASGAVHLQGCILQPTFNNGIAFIVGTGNGMRVSDIAVVGPNNAYRGNLNSAGVGIGIACGSGGATGTLIENTYVRYFYVNYKTCAMGNGSSSDSNTFRKVAALDGYMGIFLSGTQAYIDDVVEPYFNGNTIGVNSVYSKQVNIFGGNLSNTSSASNAFAISGVSASNCGAYHICVTATIASPDGNIPNVYNTYTILTPHYGLIPFTETSWNSSTGVMVLNALPSWEATSYGPNCTAWCGTNNLFAELNAATMLYAAEQVYTTEGQGIQINGTHIENDSACTALFVGTDVWGGQASNSITDTFFDYYATLPQNATLSDKYCQLAFPFISDSVGGPIRITGGGWGLTTSNNGLPYLLDLDSNSIISGKQLAGPGPQYPSFNIRLNSTAAYGQLGPGGALAAVARGTGRWDADYFLPSAMAASGDAASTVTNAGEMMSNFCGFEPCPWTTPNLSPTVYSLVSGSLGALGTYPPIACRTVFKSVDWNTAALTHLYLRSASCPGYSYGQNLTQTTMGSTANATGTGYIDNGTATVAGYILHWTKTTGSLLPGDQVVGGSILAGTTVIQEEGSGGGGTDNYLVSSSAAQAAGSSGSPITITSPSATWAYEGDSPVLYVDATTMQWMFPGLGISINNGSGAQPYTVTGVYPYLGYVTGIWAGNASGSSGSNNTGFAGSSGTLYSCASACTIAETPFAWTAY